jgi:hypothetical protein
VLTYSEAEQDGHDRAFQRQSKFRFNERRMARNKLINVGQTTRSMAEENLDLNNVAFDGKSINFKALSCLTIKDVFYCVEGTPLLLCIAKDLNGVHKKKLSNESKKQQTADVGRDE